MHSKYFISIAILLLAFTFRINATEPLCHTTFWNGICYRSVPGIDVATKCLNFLDNLTISGTITQIHSEHILANNYPTNGYFQFYFHDLNDTLSRFKHYDRIQKFGYSINPDSIYAKVISLVDFTKATYELGGLTSLNSDMFSAVDSNFVLISWDTPVNIGDSIVIKNYRVTFDISCSNQFGIGYYTGDYTIYPANASAIGARPRSQRNDSKILVYTVDGKTQDKPQQFTPVVKVKSE